MSPAAQTVGLALRAATVRLEQAGKDGARLDAEVLLARVLEAERSQLITGRDRALGAGEQRRFADLVERRAAGEPVAYLIGEKEFFSLPFAVDARVLIPRPETEDVVEAALGALATLVRAGAAAPLGVVDVGTGSGAIAVTFAHEAARRHPAIAVACTALDRSRDALAVARHNAARHLPAGVPSLLRADGLSALRAASVDLVVANPPYLSDDDLAAVSTEVAREPVAALLGGGKDGSGFLRALVADAARVLRPGGFLVSEIGSTQGRIVEERARDLGFAEVRVLPDLAGLDRIVVARWRCGSP